MMQLKVDAALGHRDFFGFEELALEAGVGFADQELPAGADDAMPGNAFSGWGCGHGVTSSSSAAAQAQSSSNIPISKNTPARDLFHQAVDGIPGHAYPFRQRRIK